jgi:hypothetical protein
LPPEHGRTINALDTIVGLYLVGTDGFAESLGISARGLKFLVVIFLIDAG